MGPQGPALFFTTVCGWSRRSETQPAAAIGLHQLRKADYLHGRRVELAKRYTDILGEVDELILPKTEAAPGQLGD